LLALMSGSDKYEPQMVQGTEAGFGENLMAGLGLGANLLGPIVDVFGRRGTRPTQGASVPGTPPFVPSGNIQWPTF
jgi:hypothetical protein